MGQLRSFHLLPAMPNGPDVNGMSTAWGGATHPSTYELQCRMGHMSAGCVRRRGGTKAFHLQAAMPNGPDVSGMRAARVG